MSTSSSAGEEVLRQEIAGLPVDEILALCYAFSQRLDRLRLYLDVLRKRGGERAQFAACLICFDLARQGDRICQTEFAFLADTMRSLAAKGDMVATLVSSDPYLSFLWELCSAQIESQDPRFDAEPLGTAPTEFATLNLLSDDDFGEFGVNIDEAAAWMSFDEAVEDFLGGEVGMAVYDPDSGFRLNSSRDVVRVERFVRELDSLCDLVPLSRGYRALVLLFYGTHIRSKSLFGGVNPRKQELLQAGLAEFMRSGPAFWEIAGVLSPLHMAPDAWDKISEVLIDYMQWLNGDPHKACLGLAAYDAVNRLIEKQPLLGNRRRSER